MNALIQCSKCTLFVSAAGEILEPQPVAFMRVVVPGLCEFCRCLPSIEPVPNRVMDARMVRKVKPRY